LGMYLLSSQETKREGLSSRSVCVT
jgi:hypothetical protein